MIINVPYRAQEKQGSCAYASLSMVLQYLGFSTTEQELRELHYIDHDVDGTAPLDLMTAITKVGETTGVPLKATVYFDPTEGLHSLFYKGSLEGKRIVSLQSPQEFVSEHPVANTILGTLWENAKRMHDTAEETSSQAGDFSPVSRKEDTFYADIYGCPKKTIGKYLEELNKLQQMSAMGHDVRLYHPSMQFHARVKRHATDVKVNSQESIQGFIESELPVIGSADGHTMVVIGYHHGLVVHDPEQHPMMFEGTKLHTCSRPSSFVVVQHQPFSWE